jgi:hypothetical protein
MRTTPFPTRPSDVVPLTVPEFTSEVDLNTTVSFDRICQIFLDDANRALVWLIRYRALTTWRERGDIAIWLELNPSHAKHACEVAASFELNDNWEFDSDVFRSTVQSIRR